MKEPFKDIKDQTCHCCDVLFHSVKNEDDFTLSCSQLFHVNIY